MECKLILNLLPNYLDDELPEELGDQVRSHLIRCRHCAWEVESIRQTLEAFKQSGEAAEPNHDFRERLFTQLLKDHRASMGRKPYLPGRKQISREPESPLELIRKGDRDV